MKFKITPLGLLEVENHGLTIYLSPVEAQALLLSLAGFVRKGADQPATKGEALEQARVLMELKTKLMPSGRAAPGFRRRLDCVGGPEGKAQVETIQGP